MSQFLYDKGEFYSYEQLLFDISSATSYIPLYKYSKIYDFFRNFIIGLINNEDLILLDADIKPSEVDGLDESLINIPICIDSVKVNSKQDIVSRIQQSKSEITIFTSGTTGQPKKVVHSIQKLTRTIKVSSQHVNDVWGFCYNPTHMAGLQVFFQAFENLNKIVNIFNASREDVYKAIELNHITHISATPTFYRLLLPIKDEYKSVIRVTFGGEKSDAKLYENIKHIFPNAKINNIYASTEAGSLFTAKGENFQIPQDLKSCFKIIDNELLIHKSLLGDSENFIYDGDYYRSGDLIEWVDKTEGLFKFVSRKNSMINIGGYKVNPEEVEAEILQIDGVQEAVVYGKKNSILGNLLCAEIKIEKGKDISENFIRHYLKDKLQDFKIPRRIKFVTEFSLTRTGKLKRK